MSAESSAPNGPTPVFRSEPYVVLFPVGVLLAWAGVVHWLLHGLGLLPDYRPVFHAITQVQGFMMSFAAGFLLTAIPRRTETPPPSSWVIAVAVIAPIGCTISAWNEAWAVSQAFWGLLALTLIAFSARRFLTGRARRRPPNSFIWIPVSFAIGIAGSLLIAVYGILGDEYYVLHDLGRALLLQGMFIGLIVGLGGMLFPLLLQGRGSIDAGSSSTDRWQRLGHLVAAAALVASFWVEGFVSLRGGLALRAVLVAVLLLAAGLWRSPTVPGWHRRLIRVAAWAIPAGYALAAIDPSHKKAGLHVVFIGGFATLALTIGFHVVLAHGGFPELVRGRPWVVPFYGGLLLLSIVFRGLVDYDQQRFFLWIVAASAAFLTATILWLGFLVPRLARRG
jgi:uncharacterized protein involved in response to NO